VIAISCSEDDQTKANQMIIDGVNVKIENAFVAKYTNTSTNKTFYDIFFTSDGIEVESFPNYDDFIGDGDFFSITLETNDPNNLPAGEYTTYDYAALYKLVNGDWDFVTSEVDLDGSIKVTKSGSTYTFEFIFTGDTDCSVYYRGTLTEVRLGR
jgi:hypothetical protein